jgi:hypothetical protein
MLESSANWRAVAKFVEDLMTSKEEAEFARQSLQGLAPARHARRRVTGRRNVH